MKTIHKITLVLIALLLVAGMLLSSGGPRQAAASPAESGGVQVAQEMEIDVPEWGPIPLDGDEFELFNRVAWNT